MKLNYQEKSVNFCDILIILFNYSRPFIGITSEWVDLLSGGKTEILKISKGAYGASYTQTEVQTKYESSGGYSIEV